MKKIKFEYQITFAYIIIGCLWIIFSDRILLFFYSDSSHLTLMQTLKGWFYVLMTALLLVILLKNHLNKLHKAEKKALESDKLKTAFLSNISHEIRTPLNRILGFADLLKSLDLSKEQQNEFIEIINRSSERMLNTINDIIEISRIVTEQISINKEEIFLNTLLDEIYQKSANEIDKENIELKLKKDNIYKNIIIHTDKQKLTTIIKNLLKNSIKFTDKGSIEFGYTIDNKLIRFYVCDDGIGIPKDKITTIFDSFYKADTDDIMAKQGPGLGLSIAKAYVEILGGNIWVESEENQGSVFYFTLPVNLNIEEDYVKKEDSLHYEKKKLKILIAEDDEISAFFLTSSLKNYVKEFIQTSSGKEAVEICKKNPDIDLVLLDIKMPDLNGLEACKQIREFNKNIIIIAQTAYGLIGDKDKAIAAGCNDYIAKPFSVKEIRNRILLYYN